MVDSELNLIERTWLIPAARMKGRREHLVPLTERAVVLIKEAIQAGEFARKAKVEHLRKERRSIPNDWPIFPSPT